MASHDFVASRARLAPATPASGGEAPLNTGAIRAKLIIVAALAALAMTVIACGGGTSTKEASLNALSAQVGCLATTGETDLSWAQYGTCWFTPLPDHPITTEEMLQFSASTQAKLDAMKVVTLTVYTGSFGDMSAEEITNEKFQALTKETCDATEYYVRGSNWFTDSISDVELAKRIATASHGETRQRLCYAATADSHVAQSASPQVAASQVATSPSASVNASTGVISVTVDDAVLAADGRPPGGFMCRVNGNDVGYEGPRIPFFDTPCCPLTPMQFLGGLGELVCDHESKFYRLMDQGRSYPNPLVLPTPTSGRRATCFANGSCQYMTNPNDPNDPCADQKSNESPSQYFDRIDHDCEGKPR